MIEHEVVSREEWATARQELLAREKEHTRMGDELARRRRELPWKRPGRRPTREWRSPLRRGGWRPLRNGSASVRAAPLGEMGNWPRS